MLQCAFVICSVLAGSIMDCADEKVGSKGELIDFYTVHLSQAGKVMIAECWDPTTKEKPEITWKPLSIKK